MRPTRCPARASHASQARCIARVLRSRALGGEPMRARAALLLVAGGLVLSACGRERVEPREGGGGATFVYARGKEGQTADPANATDGESALLLTNVFDTL